MTKRILVPIAPGTEEMEAVTIIDILVRAGYQVVVASADFDGKLTMTASRGVTLTAECKLVDVADDEFDAVVLAGGVGGAENFRDSTLLVEIIKQQKYDGRLVAAICASPAVVLQHHDLFPGALMTCHPNFQDRIPQDLWRNRRVTFDVNNNLLTSQGPGTALEFAVEIIVQLSGKELAREVALPLVALPQLNYEKLGEE
ncbi:DJ-1/PfpI family protein [Vibrio fluvialis]|jgi:4-methyl-5(b-hydroxyethyl)-thiazole monophosphate biosynthesis|uniref:4-methyl-5(Beta-hydroxyethyl)-thiazole monophosphate synthesis protein n=4 Tax=Vibrio TaxID=662 RepID=A0AAX2LTI6_VIBFL|nr:MULTISPECIES: DJ-1 family glyoxalase III [Vibrio]TNF18554.1 MAG: DJ-1 family protein [Vibrionaceae bacterium]AMF95192.1 DJ-1 family protein [Vibrio fluvialis]EKO3369292.1 DJ-1/PfpI family protein [Vibrio fluvialis]EKO3370960.1 DJ-1/PfpI family protein [Vibrio fluvialis]EKO3377043.1 DJ-1/PfpI family protein [Vibrio fluvialis]